MRKTISKYLIILLSCLLVVELVLMYLYFPQIEKYKKELQASQEIELVYNNQYLSTEDQEASKYTGKVYREGSTITSLSEEKVNPGIVKFENMSLTEAIILVNGQEYKIEGNGRIELELPNDVNIKVLSGTIIMYN